jgi:hypothetical protein
MDFPSREEARVYARLQAQGAAAPAPNPPVPPPAAAKTPARPASHPLSQDLADATASGQRFRVEKQGFESDVFDRRGIRNLIRTGEVTDADFVSVDEAAPVSARQVPFLKSLFKLRSTSSAAPPARCRTHTDQLAFYKCKETGRPLCEECAQEKKFGNTIARVCVHCGGTVEEFAAPPQ